MAPLVKNDTANESSAIATRRIVDWRLKNVAILSEIVSAPSLSRIILLVRRSLIGGNCALGQLNCSLSNADCRRKSGPGQSHRQCARDISIVARGTRSKVVKLSLGVSGRKVSDNASGCIRYCNLTHRIIANARDSAFLQLGRHLLRESARTNEGNRQEPKSQLCTTGDERGGLYLRRIKGCSISTEIFKSLLRRVSCSASYSRNWNTCHQSPWIRKSIQRCAYNVAAVYRAATLTEHSIESRLCAGYSTSAPAHATHCLPFGSFLVIGLSRAQL